MNKSLRVFILSGLLVAIGLAVLVSPWADSDPDGLNRVAIDHGFANQERRHTLSDTPIAGYSVKGVDNERMSTALSGLLGVAVTFALAAAFTYGAHRRRATRGAEVDEGSPS